MKLKNLLPNCIHADVCLTFYGYSPPPPPIYLFGVQAGVKGNIIKYVGTYEVSGIILGLGGKAIRMTLPLQDHDRKTRTAVYTMVVYEECHDWQDKDDKSREFFVQVAKKKKKKKKTLRRLRQLNFIYCFLLFTCTCSEQTANVVSDMRGNRASETKTS